MAKQLQEVQAERDRAEAETAVVASPVPARVAGRAVLLIPHRARSLTRLRSPCRT
ncbi:hypothetical protein [Streptomyces sp. A012304]|uniref:hypothetical protein n=1 Tax=Streptomyces sp. A012304 TaxID=375446 RepID=UPI002852B4C0|nr:hypothetical protein [Streptomyces sp. A012304]